jgi:hypothetical protein
MHHHLLTFGRGERFINASLRLCKEASYTQIFDFIHVYNDKNLRTTIGCMVMVYGNHI